MSGGSYNYQYHYIASLASEIRPTTPLRRAFKKHLELVAKACHDIEWVDSGDCSKGYEDMAIKACLSIDKRMKHAVLEAKEHMDALKILIKEAEKK